MRLWGSRRRDVGARSRARTDGDRRPTRDEPLWHGRFGDGPADELLAFTVSLPFDQRLAADDLAGSRAHVARPRAGRDRSTDDEARGDPRRARPRRGRARRRARSRSRPTDEDIHTAIERRVTELAGAAGAKLHTGRSRNDQVATDLRLFVQARGSRRRRARVIALQQVLLDRADRGRRRLPPRLHPPAAGPAGAARAPPARARLGARPRRRPAARRTSRALDVSPLGAGALAGSSLPLDPDGVAADLGFAARVRELARRGVRPRLRGRGAVRRSRCSACTCRASARRSCCGRPRSSASCASPTPTPPASSMLPQKKNPDIAELARGKAGRLDRRPHRLPRHAEGPAARVQPRPAGGQGAAVRRASTRSRSRSARSPGCSRRATFDTDAHGRGRRRPDARRRPTSPSTSSRSGMPFREAHAVVGGLVRESIASGRAFPDLVRADELSGSRAPPSSSRGPQSAGASPGGRRPRRGGGAARAIPRAPRRRPRTCVIIPVWVGITLST